MDTLKIDEHEDQKMRRTARRNAVKKNGGQDKYRPRVEKVKVRYNRKKKHENDFNEDW